MAEVKGKLTKLYTALETGEFKGGELAPWIKAFFGKLLEKVLTKAAI